MQMQFVKPLQIQAYETLKSMILGHRFDQQVIYSETKLSQELGISRTPVRDAIQRLAQEGYLDIIPSKGFRLHRMARSDLIETYQIRCALEGFCAVQLAKDYKSLSAKRTLTMLEKLLQEQHAVVETTRSIQAFTKYDREFHEQIVYYLGNSSISQLFDSFRYRMESQIALSLRQENRMDETVLEHQAVLDNIKMGAVGRTYEAVLAHLEKPKEIIQTEEIVQAEQT